MMAVNNELENIRKEISKKACKIKEAKEKDAKETKKLQKVA